VVIVCKSSAGNEHLGISVRNQFASYGQCRNDVAFGVGASDE
jgi:hypothetical protein